MTCHKSDRFFKFKSILFCTVAIDNIELRARVDEDSGCCMRQFCQSIRGLMLKFTDQAGETIDTFILNIDFSQI